MNAVERREGAGGGGARADLRREERKNTVTDRKRETLEAW